MGLIFSVDKCWFGFANVKLLRHGLSRYGLHMLTKKVISIMSLNPLKMIGKLHRIMGMFGYYWAFIH